MTGTMFLPLLIATVRLLAPAQDATVTLIPDGQRAVIMKETLAEREAVFAEDRKNGEKIKHDAYWRKFKPLLFRWEATNGEKGPWEVQVAKKPDFSDSRLFFFSDPKINVMTGRAAGSKSAGKLSFVLPFLNLEVGTRYYWRVTSDLVCGRLGHARNCGCKDSRPSVTSEAGTFVTEDLAPRWIELEGSVRNFRDLGGRYGLEGRRVRQGLVFRSQGLNENSVDGIHRGKIKLTVSDAEYLTGTLGIRTELDLRTPAEAAGLDSVSPLGSGVRYVNRFSLYYKKMFTPEGMRIMAENFRLFVDRDNYPILFHCIAGADRTGALAYVLEGTLGVSRREIETDWESTFYPNIPVRGADGKVPWNSELHFNEGFAKYGGEHATWNDRIVLYLKDCGVTDEEIAAFRSIMLEDRVR